MKLKVHLATMHSDAAEHHRDCAKSHDVYSKALEAGPEKKFHETMRDCHIAAGEKCVAHARAASKLDDSIPVGDLRGPEKVKFASAETRFTKDASSEVAGIHPEMPERLRMMPRSGDLRDLAKTQAEEKLAEHPAYQRRDTSAA